MWFVNLTKLFSSIPRTRITYKVMILELWLKSLRIVICKFLILPHSHTCWKSLLMKAMRQYLNWQKCVLSGKVWSDIHIDFINYFFGSIVWFDPMCWTHPDLYYECYFSIKIVMIFKNTKKSISYATLFFICFIIIFCNFYKKKSKEFS